MVVPDYHKMPGKLRGGIHMPVKEPDAVQDSSLFWLDLGFEQISFDPDIVITRKYLERDAIKKRVKDYR